MVRAFPCLFELLLISYDMASIVCGLSFFFLSFSCRFGVKVTTSYKIEAGLGEVVRANSPGHGVEEQCF